MAILASIISHSGPAGVWPGVRPGAVPGCRRLAMRTLGPACLGVTHNTQGTTQIRHHQELALIIVMRVMTTRALQLTRAIQFDAARQATGIYQLSILSRKRLRVSKGNRMIITEILAQTIWATGHVGRTQHRDGQIRIHNFAQGYRPIVATQAQNGRTRRLAGHGMRGTAGIWRIGKTRIVAVPKGTARTGVMGGMTKNTDTIFVTGPDTAWTGRR